jgi:2-polyprenyl-3-methyl-5-hydroxy-6-metoxy-1,4-benzoquinol methylase
MRIGPIAESWFDRLAIWLGLGPRPLLDTHATLLLAQTVMVGVRLGVIECLVESPLPASEVAARCALAAGPTAKLLDALVASRYVRRRNGLYSLTRDARRWLARDGSDSLRDNVLFRFVEWDWIGGLEGFVRSGQPVDIHTRMSGEQWEVYQRGMRSLARVLLREVVWRTPVPRRATAMLDVGGAHGLFAAGLCRRHVLLRAEILDLPDAVASAAPMLAAEGLGDRVLHRPGDVLTEDLGADRYDLVFVANLLHHFAAGQIRDVITRAARALKPGGVLVVQELLAPSPEFPTGQAGALADLYFALTSAAGTLSVKDLADWQRDAGLEPSRPIRFITFPGAGQQNAVKPRGDLRSAPA